MIQKLDKQRWQTAPSVNQLRRDVPAPPAWEPAPPSPAAPPADRITLRPAWLTADDSGSDDLTWLAVGPL